MNLFKNSKHLFSCKFEGIWVLSTDISTEWLEEVITKVGQKRWTVGSLKEHHEFGVESTPFTEQRKQQIC